MPSPAKADRRTSNAVAVVLPPAACRRKDHAKRNWKSETKPKALTCRGCSPGRGSSLSLPRNNQTIHLAQACPPERIDRRSRHHPKARSAAARAPIRRIIHQPVADEGQQQESVVEGVNMRDQRLETLHMQPPRSAMSSGIPPRSGNRLQGHGKASPASRSAMLAPARLQAGQIRGVAMTQRAAPG